MIIIKLKPIFPQILFGVLNAAGILTLMILSEGIKKELIRWVSAFEKVIDLNGDCLKDTAFYQHVKNHNDWGEILTARVREELGGDYPIVFKPYK